MNALRVASTAVPLAGLTGCGSGTHTSKSSLIVVGKRVGPFSIGERRARVEAVAGTGRVVLSRKPTHGEPFGTEVKTYMAVPLRVVYLTGHGRAGVFAVETTSRDYRTKSGVGVGMIRVVLALSSASRRPACARARSRARGDS